MILDLRRAKSDVRTMMFDLLTIDPAEQWNGVFRFASHTLRNGRCSS